jgi:CubicO group peptidase (beta-lactamase class C family)
MVLHSEPEDGDVVNFKVITSLVSALAIVASTGCNRSPDIRSGDASTDVLGTRLDALVPELLRRNAVPGAQIAVIDDGAVAWSGNYGLANALQSRPVADSTLFNIGSVSKTVAAWGVLALVDARADLELDAPVQQYLTRWRIPESEFDVNKVTFRRLLSHTSGLSVLPASESFTYPSSLEGILSNSYGDFGRFRLARTPGVSFEYNNGNYTLLELLVEELTDLEFATYMRQAVLGPLGMDVSTYTPRSDLLATPHDENRQPLPQAHADVGDASGGLYTTATDLASLVAATMRGSDGSPPGRGILRPETVATMITPAPETADRYGLGYKILPVADTLRMIGHDGSNPGWVATFMAAPEKGVGIMVLTNSRAGAAIVADIVCTWADWETDIELRGLCDGPRPIPRRS